MARTKLMAKMARKTYKSRGKAARTSAQQPQAKVTLQEKRRALIEQASTSLFESSELPVGLAAATVEDLKEFPDALKSFHAWMLENISLQRSNERYVRAVKELVSSHKITVEAMQAAEYYDFIKPTLENLTSNGLYAVALNRFRAFVKQRASTAAPWEKSAQPDERLYQLSNSRRDVKVRASKVAGSPKRKSLSSAFGRAAPKSDRSAATLAKPLTDAVDNITTPRSGKKRSSLETPASSLPPEVMKRRATLVQELRRVELLAESGKAARCPLCDTSLPEIAKFCPSCGKKVRCTNCGNDLSTTGKFCAQCGLKQ